MRSYATSNGCMSFSYHVNERQRCVELMAAIILSLVSFNWNPEVSYGPIQSQAARHGMGQRGQLSNDSMKSHHDMTLIRSQCLSVEIKSDSTFAKADITTRTEGHQAIHREKIGRGRGQRWQEGTRGVSSELSDPTIFVTSFNMVWLSTGLGTT